jgi:hypothetical protein
MALRDLQTGQTSEQVGPGFVFVSCIPVGKVLAESFENLAGRST